jgi:hypothetical protein
MFIAIKTGLAKEISIIKTWKKSLKVRISSIVYRFIIFLNQSLILSINKSYDIDKENIPPMSPPLTNHHIKNSRSISGRMVDGIQSKKPKVNTNLTMHSELNLEGFIYIYFETVTKFINIVLIILVLSYICMQKIQLKLK